MPLFSKLTRKLQTALTTDAKPDPPRIILEGPDPNSNLSTAEIKQKSAPVTPDPQRMGEIIPVIKRQTSTTSPSAEKSEFSNAEDLGTESGPTKPEPRPRSPRAKTNKPRSKTAPNQNVINFTIRDSTNLSIGTQNHVTYNINPGNCDTKWEASNRKPKDKSMPHDVEELSSNKEIISLDDMFLVKTHIGSSWRDVARRLGYSDGQIEQFEENHKYVDQVVYQILLDWKQANAKDAQLGELISAIWSSQEYDCAERLAASHKTST